MISILIVVVKHINIFLFFEHFRRALVGLNWLTDLFTWRILYTFETFELEISDVSFLFDSSDLLVIDLLLSTCCTFTHHHSLLDMFYPNTDNSLLEILISAVVILIFIFIFHLLSLIFDIITFDFSDIFVFAPFRLFGICSVSTADSVGASLRFTHAYADLVTVLLICALPTLFTLVVSIAVSLRLFLLVLFEISVVTSHRNVWNIWNCLI